MILKINKKAVLIGIGVLLAIAAVVSLLLKAANPSQRMIAGGGLHLPATFTAGALSAASLQDADPFERFQRPSRELPLKNPYSFRDFEKPNNQPPLITKKFETPEDLLYAYYGILKNASHMADYSGGCGTVGDSGLPYPYAYELFTGEKQKEMPLERFIDSFEGIGHITLLKLLPAFTPPGTPSGIQYYMVEIEVITGEKEQEHGSSFAYYYGLAALEKTPEDGWKIRDIRYIPEDFLCAPWHGWSYLSDAAVEIIYGENLKIIEKIDKAEQKGNMIMLYASGNGKKYRFDFVRLANGYDILLHEYVLEKNVWTETSLLTEPWANYKLTIQNSQFG